MNQEETLARLEKGKQEWNRWANSMLEARSRLKAEGLWKITKRSDGSTLGNTKETRNWLSSATVILSSQDHRTVFSKKWNFTGFIFPADVHCTDAIFEDDCSFERCTFKGRSSFYQSSFSGRTDFRGSIFEGPCQFSLVKFKQHCTFNHSAFHAKAEFRNCDFESSTFESCYFSRSCDFFSTTFKGHSNFHKSNFYTANFDRTKFIRTVQFKETSASAKISFRRALFRSTGNFPLCSFSNPDFTEAEFKQDARFMEANLRGDTEFVLVSIGRGIFSKCVFNGPTQFHKAKFIDSSNFEGSTFNNLIEISNCVFSGPTVFSNAEFYFPAHIESNWFKQECSFRAARIKHAFSLDKSKFDFVPDFTQSNWEEAPVLNNISLPNSMKIIGSPTSTKKPDFTHTARFRALKKLAIQSHDHRNEIDFFAEELRSRRAFVYKKRSVNWILSLLFECTSDYGRSILRPVLWWLPVMLLSAWSYLSSATTLTTPHNYAGGIYNTVVSLYHWLQSTIPTRFHISWLPDTTEVHHATCTGGSAVSAAFQLSTSKGLIIPGLADKKLVTQAYDCLYHGNVPFAISWTMGLQTLISAALLFLFLLGIRNRFKLK